MKEQAMKEEIQDLIKISKLKNTNIELLIEDATFEKDNIRSAQIPDLQKIHGYDLSSYKLPNKRQVLRNCVSPKLGLHILNQL